VSAVLLRPHDLIPLADQAVPVVAVKKFISVRTQARGLVKGWPIDEKPRLRCGGLREPSRLAPCSERCATARRLADPGVRGRSVLRQRAGSGGGGPHTASAGDAGVYGRRRYPCEFVTTLLGLVLEHRFPASV
jgi:hypothetical protein